MIPDCELIQLGFSVRITRDLAGDNARDHYAAESLSGNEAGGG